MYYKEHEGQKSECIIKNRKDRRVYLLERTGRVEDCIYYKEQEEQKSVCIIKKRKDEG